MAADPMPDRTSPTGLGSPRAKVALMALLLFGFDAAMLAVVPDPTTALFDSHWPAVTVVVAIAFALSERLVFHIEARNEAVSFSPSDLPLALGLLVLSPAAFVGARLAGAAAGMVLWRRPPLFKFVFNLSVFTAESLIAVAIFRSVVGAGSEATLATWALLTAAMMIGLVTAGTLIAGAISFFEGDVVARVRKELTHSYIFYLPGAVLASSTIVPFLIEPWLGLVFLLPAPLVWVVLRSHGALMHRYSDLTDIHEFSRQVGRSTQLEEIADTAVRQIADHLRAGTVALTVWDVEGTALQSCYGNRDALDALPDGPHDAAWADALAATGPMMIDDRDDESPLQDRLVASGISQAIIVPLGDHSGLLGALLVADRHGAVEAFTTDDRDRLRPITNQLVVALRKGQLHLQIQHEATHDRLTRLPNRAYFEAWAQQMLELEADRDLAVLMIDLDRFKEVNDTLGHHGGDLLLLQVTDRLLASVADGDMVSRFGGDEFAIFVPGAGEAEASVLAEVVSEAVEQPFQLGEATVAVAASIGIAVAPHHGSDCETLLRRADLAMYDAKRRHERTTVYRDDLEGRDSARLTMLADLREALATSTLDVHFQPKIDLRTREISGVEALARWAHPIHGAVPPDDFIPLAEQSGLIYELTQQVLDQSLSAVRHWLDLGLRIGVAVNLSPQSLIDERLPRMVAASLERAGVAPGHLTLEITESTMIGDARRTLRVLERLDQLGVRISVDDFGTGYSSLVNLRHLPISELKIDRSFVADMVLGRSDAVIVKSTIELGHNLGLTVVAEGVETAEVQELLRSLGCDLAQGYGLCRPLPLAKLDAWLETSRTFSRAAASGNRPFDLRSGDPTPGR